jgi:hypothetical protein
MEPAGNYLDFASKWDFAILGEFHRLAPASSPRCSTHLGIAIGESGELGDHGGKVN